MYLEHQKLMEIQREMGFETCSCLTHIGQEMGKKFRSKFFFKLHVDFSLWDLAF